MSSSQPRPALRLVADEPCQVMRLQAFRAAHPDVIIGTAEFGTWQALIPEPNGETVTTRHTLRALLDKLDELTGQQRDLADYDSARRITLISAVMAIAEP